MLDPDSVELYLPACKPVEHECVVGVGAVTYANDSIGVHESASIEELFHQEVKLVNLNAIRNPILRIALSSATLRLKENPCHGDTVPQSDNRRIAETI